MVAADAPARRPRRVPRPRVPASAEAKRLVRYDVTGGLAPSSELLVVNTDGHARQTGRAGVHSFKLTAKQLRGLKRDLKAARFKTLKRSYQPEFPVMDGQTRTVSYKGRSVSVYTGAESRSASAACCAASGGSCAS